MINLHVSVTRRHVYALLGLIAALVLIVPTVTFASDKFTDVPDSNVFHGDISWLANAGVTKGCNPPTNNRFCPSDVVRRETMAAFMHRLAVNQVVDAGSLQGFTAAELMNGSGSAAASAGDTFATATTPIVLSNEVKTEIGSMAVTIPINGGALSLTSQISLETPTSTDGSFVLLWQTIDASCPSFTGATSQGISDIATSFNEIASLTATYTITAGNHTIRTCAEAFQLVTSENTEITESQISAIWTPALMGGALSTASSSDSGSLTKLLKDAKDRAAALRDTVAAESEG
jgi:hypothetical protein